METFADYVDRVESGARAAIGLAMHELRKCGTPMSLRSVRHLELIADHIDVDGLVEDALAADGLDVVTDQRDGLRYVVQEAAA